MRRFTLAYEEQERERKAGKLKVLDAADLPVPSSSKRGNVRLNPRTQTESSNKRSKQPQGYVKRITMHNSANILGLEEDPSELVFIPTDHKKKGLKELIGVGSYPNPRLQDNDLGGMGGRTLVGTEQRRRQFLNRNRGVNRD